MSNWDKITTRDFIEIREIIYTENDPVMMRAKVLSIVTGYEVQKLLDATIESFTKLYQANTWAFGYPEAPIISRFRFKGRKFEAILDTKKMKAEQFIDGANLSDGTELDKIRNLNVLLGVVTREITPKWKFWKKPLTDQEKFDLILDMPISYVYPTVVFFCKVWEGLLPYIPDFLEKKAEELTRAAQDLSEDGDG